MPTLTLLLVLIGVTSFSIWKATREEGPPPDIILIVVDTLRRDYLGCYGFQGEISPGIDRLASESVVFDNAISAAPWTQPSVASLFTSLYPRAHGMSGLAHPDKNRAAPGEPSRIDTLAPLTPTLAWLLREEGYQTAAFYGNGWLTPETGLGRGFDHYERIRQSVRHNLERVTGYLERRSPERPFFLYLHWMDVHGPYACNQQDYELLEESPSFPPDRRLTEGEYRELRYLQDIPASWPSDELRHTLRFWNTCYAAGIRSFDRELEELLEALRRGGHLRNAIIVLTSDHGEGLLDHEAGALAAKGWEHGFSLYFDQTQIPLILRLPGGTSAGTRVREPVSSLDLMPTLLALAEVRNEYPMHGRDLTPLLEGGDPGPPRPIFSSAVKLEPRMLAVQNGTHKLIWLVPSESLALFDVAEDPAETTNLADREPQILQALQRTAADHIRRMKLQAPPKRRSRVRDAGIVEELRALGYVE